MADVAQLVERRFVVPVVAGSIPVVRPSFLRRFKISGIDGHLGLYFRYGNETPRRSENHQVSYL